MTAENFRKDFEVNVNSAFVATREAFQRHAAGTARLDHQHFFDQRPARARLHVGLWRGRRRR
jgi:NAD(P)-dependent dehydrogenase (short-subunit alcohol dehydrogenase family)